MPRSTSSRSTAPSRPTTRSSCSRAEPAAWLRAVPTPARRGVRALALAGVRVVQRGVPDMSRLVVVKLGGNVALASVPEVARMARGGRVCVVHGGGARIRALARARGIQPRFVAGRRYTDLETLVYVREGLA